MTAPARPVWRAIDAELNARAHKVMGVSLEMEAPVYQVRVMAGEPLDMRGVLALINAAAEMEQLLREIEFAGGEDGGECPVCHGWTEVEFRERENTHSSDCKLAALLALLAEARRG